MTPIWIKSAEAAQAMSISVRTLHRWKDLGIIPPQHWKQGDQCLLFRREWIEHPTNWERYQLSTGYHFSDGDIIGYYGRVAGRFLTIEEAIEAAAESEWWEVIDLLTNKTVASREL